MTRILLIYKCTDITAHSSTQTEPTTMPQQEDQAWIQAWQDEAARQGHFQRIFPISARVAYLAYFVNPRESNAVCASWLVQQEDAEAAVTAATSILSSASSAPPPPSSSSSLSSSSLSSSSSVQCLQRTKESRTKNNRRHKNSQSSSVMCEKSHELLHVEGRQGGRRGRRIVKQEAIQSVRDTFIQARPIDVEIRH